MRRAAIVMLALVYACLLQACNRTTKNYDANDTTNMAADTLKEAKIPVDKDDIKFITDIDAACLAEIKAGTLAKQKGQDKRIKNFGVMMVKDLNKGKLRLTALAKAKKVTLPDSINTADQQELSELANKT